MLLSGTEIAQGIKTKLQKQVKTLAEKSLIPTLAIIHLSDDPASASYIRQKIKVAEEIGASVKLFGKETGIETPEQLKEAIQKLNNDPSIHGIIIQRPVAEIFNNPDILLSVNKEKDVDGFGPDSLFETPIACAIEEILKTIIPSNEKYEDWLKNKNITIIGKGQTAGKPIQNYFKKRSIPYTVIDSKTDNPETIFKNSDIIISCAGKGDVIRKETVKEGVILISVGIWRDSKGKLHGDYNEEEIKDIALYFTPTPGGVGPINVACLFKNLLMTIRNSGNFKHKKTEI